MSEPEKWEKTQVSIPEVSHDPSIVEMTQKIEINQKKIVSDTGNALALVSNTRINKKKSTGHSIKKFFFPEKDIPDEYVRANSIVRKISSIPALEQKDELQDFHRNYTLKRQIAEGAQGIVWTAFDKSLKRDIIVKSTKISSPKKEMQEDIDSFVSEARIMAQLDHPSIAPIYGMYSSSENKMHITMKHIHGKNLKDYLYSIIFLYKRDGVEKFAEKESILTRIEYLIKVCDAVDYAHCKGVIHRDLKPENIIIGNHNEVYVMDWGLACLLNTEGSSDESMTEIGMHSRNELVGTPCYLAPELISGDLCSPQSDIFSLGMILFEIVTLEKAAIGETVNEVLKNIIQCKYRSFKHRFLKGKLSDDLKAIIDKATCKSLSKRYKTANDMAKDLRSYFMRNETVARPYNILRKCSRAISHHAILTSIVIVLGALLSLAIIENVSVKAQNVREVMLTHFQHGVIERSRALKSAFVYFESQLIDGAHRTEYFLNRDTDITTQMIFNKSAPKNKEYIYGTRIDLDHTSLRDKNGKLIHEGYRRTFILSEVLKYMRFTSNLRFKKYFEKSTKQTSMNNGVPIIWTFIDFKDGSTLSYPGKNNHVEVCNSRKRSAYKKALTQKDVTIWSEPFMCMVCSRIVICCLRGISSKENKSLGVIGIYIDLEYIQRILARNTIPGMKRYLINNKGEILLPNNLKYKSVEINLKTKSLILKKFSFNKELQEAVKEKKLQFRAIRDNKEYIFGISHILSPEYYYIEQISEKKLLEYHKKYGH